MDNYNVKRVIEISESTERFRNGALCGFWYTTLMKRLDTFLDGISMYKLLPYGLMILSVYAVLLGAFGVIAYKPLPQLISLATILLVALGVHFLFKTIYKAPANVESTLITSLILFFILEPSLEIQGILFIALTSAIAIVSKYVIAYHNKHIFNPVAIALLVIGLFQIPIAFWWVATLPLSPFVLIFGLLVVKKIRKFPLFLTFIGVVTIVMVAMGILNGTSITAILYQEFISYPVIFFGAIMLTEPFTTPPTRKLQIIYAIIVGLLFAFPFHIGTLFYSSPAFALVVGNIFSYAVSIRSRLFLIFKEKIAIAADTYEFVFKRSEGLPFIAGEYMEWTLPHSAADYRGIRRYFTIASSPEDEEVRLGVKMVPTGGLKSSFKTKLMSLNPGDGLYATAVAGDFVLPKDASIPLVFIAGGIGITPYVSMLRSLLSRHEKRSITLFYCNKTSADIAYKDLLKEAEASVGIKVVHVLSNETKVLEDAICESGFITDGMIKKYCSDRLTCMYYLSGPAMMVDTYKNMLKKMGARSRNIMADYFPGFA